MSGLHGLALHAERLERDDVWTAVSDALGALERRGGRATLFVHPRSAIVAGADLGDRIRALLGRGHEVAQHTHFYARGGDVGGPADDLSEMNVRACLERDRDYILRSGADPRGFTAGAWRESSSAATWLEEEGFRYDCTGRTFALHHAAAGVDPATTRSRISIRGGVLDLPTTASIADAARQLGRRVEPLPLTGEDSYELLYVHDYDLVRAKHRLAWRLVVTMQRGAWFTARELADRAEVEPTP